MIILAIDTSCDETSVAVTEGTCVLSNVISSQIRYHKKFGGVVPFLAQRLHRERIDAVVELAISRSGLSKKDIQAVAVTHGPGLAPALQVGIDIAKQLSANLGVPLYGINHMAGHIASCFVVSGNRKKEFKVPALAVLVSGGHTEMVHMLRFGEFKVIGETLDDAIGEAYDKVGKMLGLGYPGGRVVSKLAEEGDAERFALPVPMQKSGNLNFSYSGLKNAARLSIEEAKLHAGEAGLSRQDIADLCASFELVAQKSLLLKLEKALKEYPEVKSILLAGGVASNMALRAKVRVLAKKYGLGVVTPGNAKLCTDSAAMIGVAAYLGIKEADLRSIEPEMLDRNPSLRLEAQA